MSTPACVSRQYFLSQFKEQLNRMKPGIKKQTTATKTHKPLLGIQMCHELNLKEYQTKYWL